MRQVVLLPLVAVWLDEHDPPAPDGSSGRVELRVNPRPDMGRDDGLERPTPQRVAVLVIQSDLLALLAQPFRDILANLGVERRDLAERDRKSTRLNSSHVS